MRFVIAGSRDLDEELCFNFLCELNENNHALAKATQIVSGKAPGADRAGELYADNLSLSVKPFPAKWDDLTVPGAVIKINKYGKKYNAKAGHDRNKDMAVYCDAGVVLMKKGGSPGSKDMIKLLEVNNKVVYVFELNKNNKFVNVSLGLFE